MLILARTFATSADSNVPSAGAQQQNEHSIEYELDDVGNKKFSEN